MMLTVPAMMLMCSVSQLETFPALGFDVAATGVWYPAGSAASAMPLGALGTGFVDFTSKGTFGDLTTENNWLKPQPAPGRCGFTVRIGNTVVELFPNSPTPAAFRMWGHYPIADVDFGHTFGDVTGCVRAYAPLIPHDYELSGTPVAFFRFVAANGGSKAVPVEIGMLWQAGEGSGTKSEGNVECVLGWKRDSLEPGQIWRLTPTIVFGANRTELAERIRNVKIAQDPLPGKDAPEGKVYAFGAVTDFLVDALGGFNWEAQRRESAVFGGAPNIGQMFWNLSYGDTRAGRGFEGAYGLKGAALPTRTNDGLLEVRARVFEAGADSVAIAFTILNLSDKKIDHLRFGFAVNADVGGPKRAEHQHAEFDRDLGGAVCIADTGGTALAIVGQPDDCIVGTWPSAHAAMLNNEWVPVGQAPAPAAVEAMPNGLQTKGRRGSYAIAVAPTRPWSVKTDLPEEGVMRTTAVRTLACGESTEITFALAWHFPNWVSSDGENLRHRYAATYNDAGEVLAATLPRAPEIEQKIVAWQRAIYLSPTPPLLKDAIINGLYILPRNSWWIDDGRFFQSESFTGCPITETFVCRYYGSFPLALLFPKCERATMHSIAEAQAPSGEIPFGFGSPDGSRSPYYHVQHPIVSPEFVLLTWRNYALWKQTGPDAAQYLEEMYPHVQAALRFAMTLDKDQDGVINEDPGSETGFPANQYYDIWPWWGTSAYTGSIWLAALRAGEELAKAKGDTAFAEELRQRFEAAGSAFHQKLWTGAYYRLYNDPEHNRASDTSLTNALCGQWFAYATGLGEIVPKAAILSVIDTVLRLNAKATQCGAVNGVKPDGLPDETFPDHSAVITIGEVWCFSTMAVYAGRIDDAVPLFSNSYASILLNQRTPWNIPWCLDRNTGAIKWGINYYSNPCVWTLFQALDPATYLKLGKNDLSSIMPRPPGAR